MKLFKKCTYLFVICLFCFVTVAAPANAKCMCNHNSSKKEEVAAQSDVPPCHKTAQNEDNDSNKCCKNGCKCSDYIIAKQITSSATAKNPVSVLIGTLTTSNNSIDSISINNLSPPPKRS